MRTHKTITVDEDIINRANMVRARLLQEGIEVTFSELVETALKYLLFGEEDVLAKRIKEISSSHRLDSERA